MLVDWEKKKDRVSFLLVLNEWCPLMEWDVYNLLKAKDLLVKTSAKNCKTTLRFRNEIYV